MGENLRREHNLNKVDRESLPAEETFWEQIEEWGMLATRS